jgi:hypothetical protein
LKLNGESEEVGKNGESAWKPSRRFDKAVHENIEALLISAGIDVLMCGRSADPEWLDQALKSLASTFLPHLEYGLTQSPT